MSPRRNLVLTLGITLLASLGILLANWRVDPFKLGEAGLHDALPTEGRITIPEPFWHKAFRVISIKPAAVILGTSRGDWALDSGHPGFAARPAYNLALEGASVDQMHALLVHAQRTRPLRQVVIGLDLEAFLTSGRSDFDPAVLAGNQDSLPPWLNRVRLNLSWRSLGATAESLGPSGRERTATRAQPRLRELRQVFRSSEFNNFHARRVHLFPRWEPDTRWDAEPRRAASMRALRDLLSFARSESIDLRLFISPVHARYLEAYRRVGWWPMFEAWKRALVATLAAEARAHPEGRPFPLWDFSGFNNVTTEAVPPVGDDKSTMRWYIDSSHYSRQHGNLILERVLESARAQADGTTAVGVLVDGRNVEAHLRRIWQDADRYRAAYPAEVAEVGKVVEVIRRTTRK